jgi:hypothetical protein
LLVSLASVGAASASVGSADEVLLIRGFSVEIKAASCDPAVKAAIFKGLAAAAGLGDKTTDLVSLRRAVNKTLRQPTFATTLRQSLSLPNVKNLGLILDKAVTSIRWRRLVVNVLLKALSRKPCQPQGNRVGQ